jgi:hypothetical protein
MPYAQATGAKLSCEETGQRVSPLIFVDEFGADHREQETQIRWCSRDYRCVAFNARGLSAVRRARG